MRKRAGVPGQAVPLLRERLKPAAPVAPRKIDGWIADPVNTPFALREKASAGLLTGGEQAVPALQKLEASPPSQETRRRAQALLRNLTGGTLTAEQLRRVRAGEALERLASPPARQVLRTLAGGRPGRC